MNLPLAILFTLAALPLQATAQHQDKEALSQAAAQFLQTQALGLPGQVSIVVSPLDPRLKLPACAAPQPFLPNGSRAWGKTTVGVRCTVPSPWTVYLPATVRVQADYIAAALPLAQGQSITAADLAQVKGDLTTLPPGIITDPAQAIGRTLANSVPAGTPLRQDALRLQQAVQQGQTVRLVSSGAGFSVSSEARALNNAGEGQMAQVRTPSGQVVSGVARAGAIVEVNH
ncbi:MAG: flagellar basal body P-ring formation chaperone FlgA [Pseudomonadota bacterium]